MLRQDFRFFHPLRVRWVEVDLQKIVFNPHYLMYIDTAFTDYWRALAVPCDVTEWDQVRGLADAAVEAFGGIDVVVAGAGADRRRTSVVVAREAMVVAGLPVLQAQGGSPFSYVVPEGLMRMLLAHLNPM